MVEGLGRALLFFPIGIIIILILLLVVPTGLLPVGFILLVVLIILIFRLAVWGILMCRERNHAGQRARTHTGEFQEFLRELPEEQLDGWLRLKPETPRRRRMIALAKAEKERREDEG